VIREIEADAKAHGDDRRTLVQEERRAVAEVKVVDEPVTVVVSLKGWVRALKGHETDVSALQFKPGDGLYGVFPCRSVDALVVLGSNGRAYSAAVSLLPGGRGDGAPITTLIDVESGTQPAHYVAGDAGQGLLLAHTGGTGLVAKLGDLTGRNKGGKSFFSLESGETLLPPALIRADDKQVGCLALDGRLLCFPLVELKHQPKGGRGLQLMDVDAKTPLVSVAAFGDALNVRGQGRGGKPKEENLRATALLRHAGKRARKGHKIDGFVKPMQLLPLR
jgi:topoisomerase IV subunit A